MRHTNRENQHGNRVSDLPALVERYDCHHAWGGGGGGDVCRGSKEITVAPAHGLGISFFRNVVVGMDLKELRVMIEHRALHSK